jgi:hypothetical protein
MPWLISAGFSAYESTSAERGQLLIFTLIAGP